ncbi:MAG: hypothetical protein Q4G70_08005 [Pseudomonadota bacterium]|nr:hypothetical protein [Pseudomonadota bacterium]
MSADFHGFDHVHLVGERAMHPIAPRWLAAQAALLVLAGTSLPRPHPCRARIGQSPMPLVPSKAAQAALEPRHLPLPGTPITARSGASNCRFY